MSAYYDGVTGYLQLDGDLADASSLYFPMPTFPSGIRQMIVVLDAEFTDSGSGKLNTSTDEVSGSPSWVDDIAYGFSWSTSLPTTLTEARDDFVGMYVGEFASNPGFRNQDNRILPRYSYAGTARGYWCRGDGGGVSYTTLASLPGDYRRAAYSLGYYTGTTAYKTVYRFERSNPLTNTVQLHVWSTSVAVNAAGMQSSLDPNNPFGYLVPEDEAYYEVFTVNTSGTSGTNWISAGGVFTPPTHFHARQGLDDEDIDWSIKGVYYQYAT